jgi:hypothetical protein
MKNQFQVSFSLSVEVARDHDRRKKSWWIKSLRYEGHLNDAPGATRCLSFQPFRVYAKLCINAIMLSTELC